MIGSRLACLGAVALLSCGSPDSGEPEVAPPASQASAAGPGPSLAPPPEGEIAENPMDPEQQFAKGFNLLYGRGVKANPRAAVGWFRKAAEQGHARGQVQIGMALLKARGTQRNVQEALKWLRLAAEQHHPKAQLELGIAYRDGIGVHREPVTALMWLTLAAQGGGLAPRVMAPSHARMLSADERREAQERAREWRVDHGLPPTPPPGAMRQVTAGKG